MLPTEIAEELKRTAKAATPGPWEFERVAFSNGDFAYELITEDSYFFISESHYEKRMKAKFDADHIAAASPDRILALVEDWKSLRDQVLHDGVVLTVLERDNAMLRATVDQYANTSLGKEICLLKAENEKLRESNGWKPTDRKGAKSFETLKYNQGFMECLVKELEDSHKYLIAEAEKLRAAAKEVVKSLEIIRDVTHPPMGIHCEAKFAIAKLWEAGIE